MEKTTCLPTSTQEGARMNEIKDNLRSIEQTYKVFKQQQFTFVTALEHTRDNAHDKIKPVSSIGQVQTYTDHYCNNATDKRILLMFLNICCELSRLCQKLESLHPGSSVTNALLDKCKTLVSHSNDLSGLRAKYPHDVVNHLSCDEARNHYGGVVSLIPIVLDCIKEWVSHTEKLPRNLLQTSVSGDKAGVIHERPKSGREVTETGLASLQHPTFHTAATQTTLTLTDKTQALERNRVKTLPSPLTTLTLTGETQALERKRVKTLPPPVTTLTLTSETQALDPDSFNQDKTLPPPVTTLTSTGKTQGRERNRVKKLPSPAVGKTRSKFLGGPWRPPGRGCGRH